MPGQDYHQSCLHVPVVNVPLGAVLLETIAFLDFAFELVAFPAIWSEIVVSELTHCSLILPLNVRFLLGLLLCTTRNVGTGSRLERGLADASADTRIFTRPRALP